MRVQQSYKLISIDQTAYLKEILEKFRKYKLKKYNTPAIPNEPLEPPAEGEKVSDFPYQSVVGCLIWLLKTRPDIAFAVSQCARFMSNHTAKHDRAALRILGYLLKNPSWAIGFKVNKTPGGPVKVEVFADSLGLM